MNYSIFTEKWRSKGLFVLMTILSFSTIWGQTLPPDTLAIFKIRDKEALMTTDHLGALYIVERNQITKYPKPLSSKKRVRFSDPQNGEIAHIDAFNPLSVVVLYKPFNIIQIIDNQLNRASANFSPEQLGIMDIQLVSSADQNMIWLYDQSTDRLHRFNTETRRVEFQSQIITKLAGMEVEPNYLVSDMNGVYLNCPERGILVFDFFGNHKKTIPITGLQRFQVKNQNLIFRKDGVLEIHSLERPKQSKVQLPGTDIRRIRLEDNYIFVLTEKSVLVFENPFLNP
ncbi:MAG: hypothetical protein JJU02_00165 [Cryomorphaceae bacterium]|nr:hypothetical protein [Cryomorphaceae bacterium]